MYVTHAVEGMYKDKDRAHLGPKCSPTKRSIALSFKFERVRATKRVPPEWLSQETELNSKFGRNERGFSQRENKRFTHNGIKI